LASKADAREQYLYLTTRGRKSGLPREIEIWFVPRDDRYYLIAEYPTSHWVLNLQADSQVKVRMGDNTFSARAKVLSKEIEPDLHHAVQELFRQKYGWGEGLVVELTPEAGPV
jgi:deazaflavin-dependent oxidoreductase (nitroreductase family)